MSLTTERTIPCRLCGRPTPMLGTKLCNPCWETDRAVTSNPDLARKILAGMASPMATPTNEEVRRQFEAWARGTRLYRMAREESDPRLYEEPMTQGSWEGYQAALSSPAVVALVEALDQAVTSMQDSGYQNSHVAVRSARAALTPFATGAGHVE